ncbi:hypothetical protein C6496_02760 [Candidatus Poribacteria bacterium]|nr:MAG: hypothetical protein C6496_02760 [Candidatus Poribacteria bacterium]
MDAQNDFERKRRQYMPTFPKATGKPTPYIEGYPCDDREPMPANEFHGLQTYTLFDQFLRYFQEDAHIYVGMGNFNYYREGNLSNVGAADVYVILGAAKFPLHRSSYPLAEGTVPTTVFEFLSDAMRFDNRNKKVEVYLRDMGVQEYFIHQPDTERPIEFRGWQRNAAGNIVEIEPDAQGGLFSEALNLYFQWEDQHHSHVRLLRPYLPDGTPITTSMEEHRLRVEEQRLRVEAEEQRDAAERLAAEETQRRREAEAELERLRAQLAK